jgi:HAD superfamily hydrolase (TIGR01549 family)
MIVKDFVKNKKILFWDFDGVIKDSVEVKSEIFVQLFSEYGLQVVEKIKEHHRANGGMSRFEKFPIYLNWAGINYSKEKIIELNENFNKLSVESVINSSWVSGVEYFLRNNPYNQIFILISATPINELLMIIEKLDIKTSFKFIFGYPDKKNDIISMILRQNSYNSKECLMIGDSLIDFNAAKNNNIDFLLRKRVGFENYFKNYNGYQIDNFDDL